MHAEGRRFDSCRLQRGIKMKTETQRWIKDWWKAIAATGLVIAIFILTIMSISLFVADFNESGGFHGLAVSMGKEWKSIMKDIDED